MVSKLERENVDNIELSQFNWIGRLARETLNLPHEGMRAASEQVFDGCGERWPRNIWDAGTNSGMKERGEA